MSEDAGPNTFVPFGTGATQATRLHDGDDATGIRSAYGNQHSRFQIDASAVPRDIGRIVQLTLLARERFAFTCTNGCWYACYAGGELVQSILVFNSGERIADYQRDLLVTGEELVEPDDLVSLEISVFNKGWVDGDRWEIAELSVQLTYVPQPQKRAVPPAPDRRGFAYAPPP